MSDRKKDAQSVGQLLGGIMGGFPKPPAAKPGFSPAEDVAAPGGGDAPLPSGKEQEGAGKSPAPRTAAPKKGRPTKNDKLIVARRPTASVDLTASLLPPDSKYLVGSNVVTMMSADLNTMDSRVLVAIIEALQISVKEKLNEGISNEQLTLFGDEYKQSGVVAVNIPLRNFGVSSDNYRQIWASVARLAGLVVQLNLPHPVTGEESRYVSGMLEAWMPKTRKANRYITIKLKKDIADAMVSFDKGYTRFLKAIAVGVQGKYTVRIYLFISSWQDAGGVQMKIGKFRKWLSLEHKYPEWKDINKRILEPAKKELKQIKSNCNFEAAPYYTINKEGEKVLAGISWKIYKTKLTKTEIAELEKQKTYIGDLLKRHLHFTDSQVERVTVLVNQVTYGAMLNKVMYLIEHIKEKNGRRITIQYPAQYALKALEDAFMPTIEANPQSETREIQDDEMISGIDDIPFDPQMNLDENADE